MDWVENHDLSAVLEMNLSGFDRERLLEGLSKIFLLLKTSQ